MAAFGFAGQRCTANRRIVVHHACAEQFTDMFRRATAALSWGDPLEEKTVAGPLISDAATERVAGVLARAQRTGAKLLKPHDPEQAKQLADIGSYFSPTIVCCDDPVQEIVQEETFGPVAVIQRANDWDQAIGLCNAVRHGLVASLFSPSQALQEDFLARCRAGILKLNKPTAGAAAAAPFVGWKASGLGPPEHGVGDREFYTRHQTVYM